MPAAGARPKATKIYLIDCTWSRNLPKTQHTSYTHTLTLLKYFSSASHNIILSLSYDLVSYTLFLLFYIFLIILHFFNYFTFFLFYIFFYYFTFFFYYFTFFFIILHFFQSIEFMFHIEPFSSWFVFFVERNLIIWINERSFSCSRRSLNVMQERNSFINHCHPEIKICLLF